MGNIQINGCKCRTISSSGPQKAAAAEEFGVKEMKKHNIRRYLLQTF
jgi:hypothetical protein